jgi:NAD(P)-dependent dehydrogenase (short-subunit alcohol dehydrogenase family)
MQYIYEIENELSVSNVPPFHRIDDFPYQVMNPTRALLQKPWILVSPSSRGIGFALSRHLLRTTQAPIVATARTNPDEVRSAILHDLPTKIDPARLTVTKVDVLDESTISDATAFCADKFPKNTHHLHLALLIPGILHPERSPEQIDADKARQMLLTNVLGPMLLAKHFTHFLPSKKDKNDKAGSESFKNTDEEAYQGLHPTRATMALMSARVGSISDNKLGGWYSYRVSKAAVNQLVKTLDLHFSQRSAEAVAVGLHPGTVKTELSREFWDNTKHDELLEPNRVADMLCVLLAREGMEEVGRGRCWDYKGEEVLP